MCEALCRYCQQSENKADARPGSQALGVMGDMACKQEIDQTMSIKLHERRDLALLSLPGSSLAVMVYCPADSSILQVGGFKCLGADNKRQMGERGDEDKWKGMQKLRGTQTK